MTSLYTPELIEAICARLSTGEPLRQICRTEGYPGYRTVFDWIEKMPEVAAAVAKARAAGEDALAEECLEIADDASNDWMERHSKDGEVAGVQLNREHVDRSKLRIYTRLQLLAKWNPKKYGDQVKVEQKTVLTLQDIPDEVLDRAIADAERAKEIA